MPDSLENVPAGETHPFLDNIEERVEAALAKLGVSTDDVRRQLLAALERAADAYEKAQSDSDKTFWQNEGMRLHAAFLAVMRPLTV